MITVTLSLVVLRLIHSLVRNHRIDSTSQVQAYYHYQAQLPQLFFRTGGAAAVRAVRKGETPSGSLDARPMSRASAPRWLENEGISSYTEAAVMFKGATDAVERENELLRKQWTEGAIARVARLFKVSHSASSASET